MRCSGRILDRNYCKCSFLKRSQLSSTWIQAAFLLPRLLVAGLLTFSTEHCLFQSLHLNNVLHYTHSNLLGPYNEPQSIE